METLGQLADEDITVEALAILMLTEDKDMANYIFSNLWTISRRARVWVYIHEEPTGKRV